MLSVVQVQIKLSGLPFFGLSAVVVLCDSDVGTSVWSDDGLSFLSPVVLEKCLSFISCL